MAPHREISVITQTLQQQQQQQQLQQQQSQLNPANLIKF